MANFLNVHLLSSLAFANPNRDDAGAPKSAVYGGVERARLSSQALKRAARLGFQERTQAKSIRSALAGDIVAELMSNSGVAVDDNVRSCIDQAIRTLVEDSPKPRKGAPDEDAEDNQSGNTLSWFAQAELESMAVVLKPVIAENTKIDAKKVRKALETSLSQPSVEIAAFGRMFAASPASATDAAVQVSHALSTHSYVLEVDYFTAVDDLREHGAGHIGLSMFTGAVYYRHFCLDRAQLQANLGDRFTSSTDQIGTLIESMLVELPRGKQNSASHHSLPSLVAIIEGARPANCAEAFERPVVAAEDGYVLPSASALGGYIEEMAQFAPTVFEKVWIGGRSKLVETFQEQVPVASEATLPQLVKNVTEWVTEPSR